MSSTRPDSGEEDRRSLKRLAKLYGVQTSYLDVEKRRQTAAPETILAVLRALGAPVERPGDCPGALESTLTERARRVIAPVTVVWDDNLLSCEARLPARAADMTVRVRLTHEDGETQVRDVALKRLVPRNANRIGRVRYVSRRLSWSQPLPVGYHHLTLECGSDVWETTVLSAPTKTFSRPRAGRSWGIFVPAYALHSARSWGAGDLGDFREFVEWLGDCGGSVATTLPLLAAFLDRPFDPSPYAPVSRLFWNEFYLDISRIPELGACAEGKAILNSARLQRRLSRLRREPLVDYRSQMALKREVLEALARFFFSQDSTRRSAFEAYIRQHPLAQDYAVFRAVADRERKPWTAWPARLQRGEIRAGDFAEAARRYHLYVQWLAEEQMSALSQHAIRRGVKLYLDMPLGVRSDGFDAWRFRGLFAAGATGGAPPDTVFTKGQDWGFVPLHPERMREDGYQYVVSYLRHHLRHARMLRFDHVMGLHRLYWIPTGTPATRGAYVTYPAEELYALLSIESHRHRAIVVGENLGTVPPEVNRSMKRHGIREMFVAQYELSADPHRPLRAPAASSVASLNTHDMPPFHAYWQKSDIEDRFALGLLTHRGVRLEIIRRERIKRALTRFLANRGFLREKPLADTNAAFEAITAWLSASGAETVLLNLEDLWLETLPQNVPGTHAERTNWRRKARLPLEGLRKAADVLRTLRAVQQLRHRNRNRF